MIKKLAAYWITNRSVSLVATSPGVGPAVGISLKKNLIDSVKNKFQLTG
jgi:hypothetical protein